MCFLGLAQVCLHLDLPGIYGPILARAGIDRLNYSQMCYFSPERLDPGHTVESISSMNDAEWEVVCDRLGISIEHGILVTSNHRSSLCQP